MAASTSRFAAASTPDRLDRVLSLALDRRRQPAVHLPKRLNGLFRELGKNCPSNNPDTIEDLIWALWISHPDPEAEAAMSRACEAMAAGAPDLAAPMLDRLVAAHPTWPEAWNKRAILRFIGRDYAGCLADIAHALELEPRHFGAISAFAQLCLKIGRPIEARAALAVAIEINPHLRGVRELMNQIVTPRGALH